MRRSTFAGNMAFCACGTSYTGSLKRHNCFWCDRTSWSRQFSALLFAGPLSFFPPFSDCSDCVLQNTKCCTSIFVIGVISVCVSIARFSSTAPVQSFVCTLFAVPSNVCASKLAVVMRSVHVDIQTWEASSSVALKKREEYERVVEKEMPKKDPEECPSWKTKCLGPSCLPFFDATSCFVLRASPILFFFKFLIRAQL